MSCKKEKKKIGSISFVIMPIVNANMTKKFVNNYHVVVCLAANFDN